MSERDPVMAEILKDGTSYDCVKRLLAALADRGQRSIDDFHSMGCFMQERDEAREALDDARAVIADLNQMLRERTREREEARRRCDRLAQAMKDDGWNETALASLLADASTVPAEKSSP